MAIRRAVRVFVAASLATIALVAVSAPAGAQASVEYQPPVDAPIVEPFLAPDTAYGPGNRGLTYDLTPHTPVRASAPGEVVFAGPVADSRHVTVLHADGLRTSYSFLESVAVQRGQVVDAGDVVGTGGIGFHFGVRDGDSYLDPAALFGGTEIRVRLVPHEEPLPPTDAGLLRERLALVEVVDERSRTQRFLGRLAGAAKRSIGAFKAGLHTYRELARLGPVVDTFGATWRSWRADCTPAGDVPQPDAEGRMALLVAGFGSNSVRAGVDGLRAEELGYGPGDVLRYSYAGGRTPDPDGALDPALVGIPARPYEAEDTFEDLEAEGRELADLVEDVAEARPGVPIDLYAHSQGGIVTRLALLELERRPGGLDALGSVVTMGTPHDGAVLATAATHMRPGDHSSVELITRLAGSDINSQAESIRQMGETSELIDKLQSAGIPDGVDFRTIGARGDLVVTADKTTVAGHPSAIVGLAGPAAHNALPASSGTTREVALALAGMPPTCQDLLDHFLDAGVPETVSFVENGIGAATMIG